MPQKPRDSQPIETPRERQNGRTAKLRQAARAVLKDGKVHARRTAAGEIHIASMTFHTDEDTGLDYVEIFLSGETEGGDPHFRIFNPPIMVREPDGSFREDPMEAISEVLANYGGARPERKQRRIR